jgi:hypothetical protein
MLPGPGLTVVIRPQEWPSLHLPGYLSRERSVSLSAGHRLEAGVKNQRVRVGFGKSGQVGIRPGARSNARLGHELAPSGHDTVGLGCEDQPPIGRQLFECFPMPEDSPRNSSHYVGIRQQTKQAHLGYPAEGDRSVRLHGKPVARRHVVNVALMGSQLSGSWYWSVVILFGVARS